jgi:transposase
VTSSVVHARKNLLESGSEASIEELVADKGYHKAQTLSDAQQLGLRTYIPEPASRHRRRWTDKPAGHKEAVYANRRRVRGDRSKRLQRKRSEYVERTFAHMCETGDGRRSWLRGLEKVTKRYLIQAAARNLGVILRKLFGMGTPRGLQKGLSPVLGQLLAALSAMIPIHWRREVNPAFRRLDHDDLAFATAAA